MKLGILGGIGPQATGEFYLFLIEQLQQQGLIASNKDFPQIVINSIPAPELITDKITAEDLLLYKKGLQELDACNVDCIVMVCNTIHAFYDELQATITTPIIDLRTVVQKQLKGKDKVTILGTPATLSLGIYDFSNMTYLNPNKAQLEKMSACIFAFNKGVNKTQQKEKLLHIAQEYVAQGSQLIVLGCTEFAVMLQKSSLPTLNTIHVLAQEIINLLKGGDYKKK